MKVSKEELLHIVKLANLNIKDDLAYLANQDGNDFAYYENMKKNNFSNLETELVKRSRYLFNKRSDYKNKLASSESLNLYLNIELPLVNVLADMENTGIICDKSVLKDMSLDLEVKLDLITKEIYELAGCTFNIGSPKQLGEILFDKLEIAKGKKNKTGYKTDVKVLEKLVDKHPIVEKIFERKEITPCVFQKKLLKKLKRKMI